MSSTSDVLSGDSVVKQPTESVLYAFLFRWADAQGLYHGLLRSGETISSVTSVAIQSKKPGGSADCTIAAPAVNVAASTVDGRTSAIGEAVQVRISTGIDATDYRLTCTVVTSDSNTRVMDAILKVRD